MTDGSVRLFTVGHGTLEAESFVGVLEAAGIRRIVDVRRFPGSRRRPQFNRGALAVTLEQHAIGYRWDEALGGRRPAQRDSVNHALRNKAFQGYADHMAAPVFREAIARLLTDAGEAPTAVLCAESVWWRCHRRLVADYVTLVHGVEVLHLFHDGRAGAHEATPEARPLEGRLVYDREP